MKKVSKMMAYLLAIVMLFTLASCAKSDNKSSVERIKEAGKIVMSTNAAFEPFEYIDGDDYAGIEIDLAEKIAEELGVELVINNVEFKALVTELQTGKCDFVAAGMSYDEDKAKNIDFCDGYYNASQSIIVPIDSDIQGAEDLDGKKIGVQLGTTGATYCEEDVKDAEISYMDSAVEAVQDLLAGRLDAVVVDNFPAEKLVEKNSDQIKMLDKPLTEEEYMMAVPKGDEALKEVINKVLKDLKDSGEFDEIVGKYM